MARVNFPAWLLVCSLYLPSLALALNGPVSNATISLYARPGCFTTPEERSVAPDTCVDVRSISNFITRQDDICANGALRILQKLNRDDSSDPSALGHCGNCGGLGSIAFYCDGANGSINLSDGRPPKPPPTLYPVRPAFLSLYDNESYWADTYRTYYVQPDTCFSKFSTSFYIGQSVTCADRSVTPRKVAYADTECTQEVAFGSPQTLCYTSQSYAALAFRCNESVALTSGVKRSRSVIESEGAMVLVTLFAGLVLCFVG